MDGRLTWTDCDEAGVYLVPNVLSPRDKVSRPDNMDETVPHTHVCSGGGGTPVKDGHCSPRCGTGAFTPRSRQRYAAGLGVMAKKEEEWITAPTN